MNMNGAEAIVAVLEAFGVQHIFGLPGSNPDWYDAVFRSGIRHVLVRHEHSASHMADGYARVTRGVGVCDGSAGPGVTNLITGVSQALSDGVPLLAVLGARPRKARGRGQFQEIDQVSAFAPFTKAVIEIDSAARAPELVRQAFRIATTGRPGPVAINLPEDVAAERAAFREGELSADRRFAAAPALRMRPTGEDLERVLDLLRRARHPVLWCGGGVLASDASAQVTALAEQLGVPVATTYMGKGSLAENHPLCLGPAGAIGRAGTNRYVLDSDCVLALGSRFTDTDTAGWTIPRPGTTLVQVDIEPRELGKNLAARHGVWSDIREFARALLELCQESGWRHPAHEALAQQARAIRAAWAEDFAPGGRRRPAAPAGTVHPLQVVDALRACMEAGDVLICDSGFNQIYGGKFFEVHEQGRGYLGPRGMGTMGYSFPAAIGAKLANPGGRYVALCGDGGFAMVLPELETSLRAQAPVVVVVLNNRNLEYIKWGQKERYGARYISTQYTDTDFAAIAEAFGCRGVRIRDAATLPDALAAALRAGVTTVLDVTTPDEASPFLEEAAPARETLAG